MLIFFGFLLFISLVILHELGHFWAAKKSGVDVEEFGLGFPPKAKTLAKRNGTEYTLNWLPLGGFVKLKGEHDSDTAKGSFGAASLKHKAFVMLAGVVVNFLTAVVLISFIALVGMPKLLDNQFTVTSDTKVIRNDVILTYVEPGSPAEKAGLKTGDTIKSITKKSGNPDTSEEQVDFVIDDKSDLPEATKHYQGREIQINVLRAAKEETLNANLLSEAEVEASRQTDKPKGYLGVIPENYTVQRSTWSAPIVGVGLSLQLSKIGFQGVGSLVASLFKGDVQTAKEQTVGPVGIVGVIRDNSSLGFIYILMLIAVISLSLAIMNLLPIPVLDGGRLYLTLLFHWVLRKPLTKKIEERIVGTAYVIMMGLFFLITFLDINRFFLD